MRKRIPVGQLRVGMFIQELCGSWMEHPFWRGSFRLNDRADLQRIVDAGISEVWIDTARGLDVAGKAAERVSESAAREAAENTLRNAAASDGGALQHASFAEETTPAASIAMSGAARPTAFAKATGSR